MTPSEFAPNDDSSGDFAMHSVAVDASAVHRTSGGVRRFLASLIENLPDVGVFPTIVTRRNCSIADWPGAERFLGAAPNRRGARLVWEQTSLERLLLASATDTRVLHSPHYTMPRYRRASRLRHVVTVHDLSFFTRPQDHSREKVMLFRSAVRYAASHADAVICVSNTTANLLREHVEVSVPIHIIGHGIDAQRFAPLSNLPPSQPERETQRLRQRYDITSPYVLYLGAIEPRKNVPNLLRAYERVMQDSSLRNHTLVLAGRPWVRGAVSLPSVVHGRVKAIDFVEEPDLAMLYRNAALVTYPSFEEGFGLPVLEALASGVPVVTSKGTVMEELVNGHGICVDPNNVDEIAAAIARAISGRETLALDRGVMHARSFSWQTVAAQHRDVYRSLR
jgi:glycosyltransferase involved in cell wall biosynthesis